MLKNLKIFKILNKQEIRFQRVFKFKNLLNVKLKNLTVIQKFQALSKQKSIRISPITPLKLQRKTSYLKFKVY